MDPSLVLTQWTSVGRSYCLACQISLVSENIKGFFLLWVKVAEALLQDFIYRAARLLNFENDIFCTLRWLHYRSHNLPGRSEIFLIMTIIFFLKVEDSSGNGIYLADPGSTWRSSFPPTCFPFVPPLVLEVGLSYWLILEHAYFSFITMMNWLLTLNWVFPSHFWVDFGCMEWVDPIPFSLTPDWHCHFSLTLPSRGENWTAPKI